MSNDDFAWAEPQVNIRRVAKRHITFKVEAVKDEEKSAAEGRPIHNDVDKVEIVNPGSKDVFSNNAVIFIKMNPNDKEVREAYLAWKEADKHNIITGTPLAEVPFLSKSEIADYNALNIFSAEQLIDLSDSAKQRIRGVHTVIAQVKAWMDKAKDSALTTKQAKIIEDQNQRIEYLEAKMAEISNELNAQRIRDGGEELLSWKAAKAPKK